MPPCTFGCSVLTRPSSISGNPVSSEMSFTAMPESRNSLAVPPVETSSTPKATSLRAKSTSPDLSVTLRMARWILDMRPSAADENFEKRDSSSWEQYPVPSTRFPVPGTGAQHHYREYNNLLQYYRQN